MNKKEIEEQPTKEQKDHIISIFGTDWVDKVYHQLQEWELFCGYCDTKNDSSITKNCTSCGASLHDEISDKRNEIEETKQSLLTLKGIKSNQWEKAKAEYQKRNIYRRKGIIRMG